MSAITIDDLRRDIAEALELGAGDRWLEHCAQRIGLELVEGEEPAALWARVLAWYARSGALDAR